VLTIFTTPKPFIGHDGIIQTNAIRSWKFLRPECEIILFGNDKGTAETASELGVQHVPDLECNKFGTPLISSMFKIAQEKASHPLLCYINADIILLSDFLPAIESISGGKFLIVGQRWDLDLSELVDFKNAEWESKIRACLADNGTLHSKSGMDYFVYPKGLFDNLPPFAIGRTAWDCWLIYRAREQKAAVIDATQVVTAIHQNHDYSHNTHGYDGIWEGPEAQKNMELAGHGNHLFTLEHATWMLTPGGIRRALSPRDLYFHLDAATVLCSPLKFLRKPMKLLTRFLIRIRSVLGIGTE